MIKKILVSDLVTGMYIHDLNCSWVNHPFFLNQFKVEQANQIEKIIQAGVVDLYIDTDKGLDFENATPQAEVQIDLNNQLNKVIHIKSKKSDIKKVTVGEELIKAQYARVDAQKTIKEILIEARMGRQVDIEKANQSVSKLVDSVLRNKDALLSLDLIRNSDRYTFEHSVSVSVLLIAFGKELGFNYDAIHKLGVGGLLHDIGKTKIPDEILNKPGRLTEDEFKIIQKHVEYGGCILAEYSGVHDDSIIVSCQHHERVDGTGYPNNLKGDNISQYGQMAAIADVYDAIVSDRCYHRGEPPTSVLKKMLEWSHQHFNKELVQKFIHTVGIYPVGTLVRLENGHIAVVIEQGENGLLHPIVKVIFNPDKKGYINKPYILDLANTSPDVSAKIISYENPGKWGIDPNMFVGGY